MLHTISPEARAVLSDLSGRAHRKSGVVTNLADMAASDRALMEELVDARVIRRENESTVVVLLDFGQRTHLAQEGRAASLRLLTTSRETYSRGSDGSSNGYAVDSPTNGVRVKTRSEVSRKRPGASLGKLPVNLWRGSHLAAYFIREVGEQAVLLRLALGPSPFNIQALSGQMNRWLKEDLTSEQIKAMVDLFTVDLARHANRNVPTWKTFLARRQVLYRQAARITEEASRATGDENYWTGDAESINPKNVDWIGA